MAGCAAGRKAQRVRPGHDQEVARGLPLSLFQDQPVQALRPAEWAEGGIGWVALAARRLEGAQRLRADSLVRRVTQQRTRIARWPGSARCDIRAGALLCQY